MSEGALQLRAVRATDFRALRGCALELGPGLNVLYGPNELGKSTLAEVLRAAFLVVPGTAAARDLSPWGVDACPEVVVTFARGEEVYRVTKRFGASARNQQALLEREVAPAVWSEEVKARGVDGRLRELLGWGLPALGGKGRSPSDSYLTTALLGQQSDVDGILDAGLGEQASAGRQVITEALNAMGQDPRVMRLLARLDEVVSQAFTKLGKAKAGAAAPLAKQLAEVQRQEQALAALEAERDRSREVAERVRAMRDAHEQSELAFEAAQARCAALEREQAAWAVLVQARRTLADARAALGRAVEHEAKIGRAHV